MNNRQIIASLAFCFVLVGCSEKESCLRESQCDEGFRCMNGSCVMVEVPEDASMDASERDARIDAMPGDAEIDAMPGDAEVDAMPADGAIDAMPGDAEVDAMPGDAAADAMAADAGTPTGDAG